MYIIHKYAYFPSCYIFHIKCLQVQFISLTYHHYDDLQTILKIRPTEKKKSVMILRQCIVFKSHML